MNSICNGTVANCLYFVVNMKKLMPYSLAIIFLVVVGCTFSFSHSTDNDGFDFPSENVKKIINGKTTGNEIIQMFGGPLTKFEVNENEESWIYSFSTGTKYSVEGLLTDNTGSTGHTKTLYILLKNGTVTNFRFTESHVVPSSMPDDK
jgi:hypothetical protein